MEAAGPSWLDDAEKNMYDRDDAVMTALADRAIFSLDDIFLDIKDAPDTPRAAAPADMHAATAFSGVPPADDLLPQGLLCDDADVSQLEWLSNFCEESYSSDGLRFVPSAAAAPVLPSTAAAATDKEGVMAAAAPAEMVDQWLIFRSSSPVSVLEHGVFPPSSGGRSLSSPTSSAGSAATAAWHAPEPVAVPARSRSKRPRPPSFPVRAPIVVATPVEREGESECPAAEAEEKKKRKKKKKEEGEVAEEGAATTSGAVRKCAHCEVTKTPQWRAGPSGPKTLCNACGVRYKSGRLFPEYRPAASPTFLPAVHSNSHKKVVEMRNRVDHPAPAPAANSCELLDYLRRRAADTCHR